MKVLFCLLRISIVMLLLTSAPTFGQVVVYFGASSSGDWPNQQHNNGDTFTYLNCNRFSENNLLTISVDGSGVLLYAPSEMPPGWSFTGGTIMLPKNWTG